MIAQRTSNAFDSLKARWESVGYTTRVAAADQSPRRPERLEVWRENDEERRIIIPEEAIEYVAASEFEAYCPTDDYDAIWSCSKQTIECYLNVGNNLRMPASYRMETLARSLGCIAGRDVADGTRPEVVIDIPSPREDLSIRLCFCSSEFIIYRDMVRRFSSLSAGRRPLLPVLRLEGINAGSVSEAIDLLERIGNAVLFQIDLKVGLPMMLARRQEDTYPYRTAAEDSTLRPPTFAYDKEPMELYWYGRTAFGMPLLAFLAFYQVTEFYFPSFSTEKAQHEIRNMLKDPRFDCDNDHHLARLVGRIKPGAGGRGLGNEKTQFQTTIQACVTAQQMREFLTEDERRHKFYHRTGKQKMPVVDVSIPIGTEDADVRPQVAERLYDIRCRIVHSKNAEDGTDILLPYSREAALLRYDLQLMEFIARQVMISTSRPLTL